VTYSSAAGCIHSEQQTAVGVDSSLLAAIIARRLREPLRTFSIGFPDSSVHNELASAAAIAARHSAFEVQADELLTRLPHAVWGTDDLSADYANLPVSLLAEALVDQWRAPFRQVWARAPKAWTDLARMQDVDLETWLPDDLFLKVDRMLMAWGVEGRVPFLDHRVVALGLALPDAYKIDGRNGKRFLKLWGKRFLPREHFWAHKKGITVPVRDWLRGECLERLAGVLPHVPDIRRWVEPAGLARLLERQRRKADRSAPLWSLLNFAVWHRLFIKGGDKPPAVQDPITLLPR